MIIAGSIFAKTLLSASLLCAAYLAEKGTRVAQDPKLAAEVATVLTKVANK